MFIIRSYKFRNVVCPVRVDEDMTSLIYALECYLRTYLFFNISVQINWRRISSQNICSPIHYDFDHLNRGRNGILS